jgi:hypothetical protein
MKSHFMFLALCAFPISFDTLWKVAAVCCIALIVTMVVVFRQKRLLRRWESTVLLGITLVGSLWSLALAITASRNTLICAGTPGASADLVRSADESYHTLIVFQSTVITTSVATIVIIIASATVLYYIHRRRLR